jgi:hypothetical protein
VAHERVERASIKRSTMKALKRDATIANLAACGTTSAPSIDFTDSADMGGFS